MKRKLPVVPVERTTTKTIGYARVSTGEQSTDIQIEKLRQAGCDEVITDDGISGARADNRPGLKRALESLRVGDKFIVYRLDRLARSLADLIVILDGLKAKGVGFRSLNEAIDTETATGRLMWQIVGAFAEFERQVIRERVAAGHAHARLQGVKFGRPSKLSAAQLAEAVRMRQAGKTCRYIMGVFKIGRTALYDALKKADA